MYGKELFKQEISQSRLLKYKTNIDDVGGKRRYTRNILQWSKNDFKSKNNTNGDYLGRLNNSVVQK